MNYHQTTDKIVEEAEKKVQQDIEETNILEYLKDIIGINPHDKNATKNANKLINQIDKDLTTIIKELEGTAKLPPQDLNTQLIIDYFEKTPQKTKGLYFIREELNFAIKIYTNEILRYQPEIQKKEKHITIAKEVLDEIKNKKERKYTHEEQIIIEQDKRNKTTQLNHLKKELQDIQYRKDTHITDKKITDKRIIQREETLKELTETKQLIHYGIQTIQEQHTKPKYLNEIIKKANNQLKDYVQAIKKDIHKNI
ncbi:MAG: hypothetical protein ACLFN8_03990 [Candidatus Woesearchaeota archaeon]